MTRDQCSPSLKYTLSNDRSTITAVTVDAANRNCGATIPLTVPGTVTSVGTATKEQVGHDPLTLWVQLKGAAQTFTLGSPVKVL
jgi:hypothetical protein